MPTFWNDRVKISGTIESTNGQGDIIARGNFGGFQGLNGIQPASRNENQSPSGSYFTITYDPSGFWENSWCEYFRTPGNLNALRRHIVLSSSNGDKKVHFPTGEAHSLTIFNNIPAKHVDEDRTVAMMGL